VRVLLGVPGPLTADAADALAVAVCHAHARRLSALAAQQGATRPRQAAR
jgi:Holliday junction resolvasome RuvABC endonuclease subunit